MKNIITVFIIVMLVACSVNAGEKLTNPARKARVGEFKNIKVVTKQVLNPDTIDAITTMVELRVFLKKQQRVMRALVRDAVDD